MFKIVFDTIDTMDYKESTKCCCKNARICCIVSRGFSYEQLKDIQFVVVDIDCFRNKIKIIQC